MADFDDGYDGYYANRLWQLLPGIYRAQDSLTPGVDGPLQELVNRIAVQIAVVRRSIDRLWADQSIETCDDWVIPYIGDLLDTNLLANLDAGGRRRDVASTIHYRRRKGTVAILEEIARAVTGWETHVVEAFRTLSRTRHSLDPPIGAAGLAAALAPPAPGSAAPAAGGPSTLLAHEGLIGAITATPAGGFADVRSVHGAALAGSPFDELAHTADVRAGQGAIGHYSIGKLLVFVWRLLAFPVLRATPVVVSGCQSMYAFDPTGRQIPLFMQPLQPAGDDFADTWTSASEWQVPGPLRDSLQAAISESQAGAAPPMTPAAATTTAPPTTAPPATTTAPPTTAPPATTTAPTTTAPGTTTGPIPIPSPPSPTAHYPGAIEIPPFATAMAGSPVEPVTIEIWPEVGQFSTAAPPSSLVVSYQYGFPAQIGAGPYDRSILGNPPAVISPVTSVSGGALGLETALSALTGSGTVEIADSLTYTAVANPGSTADPIDSLLIQAADLQRPVIRLAPPAAATDPPRAWVFTGGGSEALAAQGLPSLTLDGLLFSGGDIVLQGAFASVRLTGFTADPGTEAGGGHSAFATSVDGRALAPTTIWIQADPAAQAGAPNAVESLEIDNCVLGPVRTRNGGAVQSISISDSVVQGLAVASNVAGPLTSADVYDPALLATVLASQWTPAQQLFKLLPTAAQTAITGSATRGVSAASLSTILDGLNGLIAGSTRLDSSAPALADVPINPDVSGADSPGGAANIAAVNRALLEAAFPVALAPAALAFDDGSVTLERVTVIGSAFLHRLTASDCIVTDFTVVEDAQHGCLRYSAVSSGSLTPRQFRCAQVTTHASLFTSTDFGQPGYGQLLETVDRTIASAASGVTISAGAENGSEMGAYCSGLAPIKENGLLIKYDEYMPLGLTPVIVHVT